MGSISLKRKKEFINFTQKFQLILDGQLINEISSGQTILINVEENSIHQLQIKLNRRYGKTFDIKVDEDINLEVTAFKYGDIFIFSLTGLAILSFLLRKTEFHFNFLIVMIVFFIVQLYSFTIGRNKYLLIRKVNKKGK